MTTMTDISTDRTVDVPKGTYPLNYSARLVRTIDYVPEGYATAEPGKADFYDALKAASVMTDDEGRPIIFPDANEEQCVYIIGSRDAKNLRNAEALRDYFGNNDKKWYAFGETRTALRFREADIQRRKPYNIGDEIPADVIVTDIPEDIRRQIADPKFTRGDFKGVINSMNRKVAERQIQYARGQVIDEMDSLGLWTKIRQTTEHTEPYALHAWLRDNLDVPRDPISGEYEVAVVRGSYWHHGERCLDVDANHRRWDADSGDGFRPVVRGLNTPATGTER